MFLITANPCHQESIYLRKQGNLKLNNTTCGFILHEDEFKKYKTKREQVIYMISLSYLFPKVGLTQVIQTGYQTLYIERYVEMNLFVKPVFLILYKKLN